jgi:hypothetical protein
MHRLHLDVRARSGRPLSGRGLALARCGWLATAGLILALDVLGTPVFFRLMATGCDGGQCQYLPVNPEQVSNLALMGVSPAFFAGYVTALSWMSTLVFTGVAAVIFWRRADDPLALFGSFALLVFGEDLFGTINALASSNPEMQVPIAEIGLIGWVSFFTFLCVFPSGHFAPRWMRWTLVACCTRSWDMPH